MAKIVEIARHPKADKLYVETVDLGTERRQIVSGLVPYYREEELLGHCIVLVANLKPAQLRGVESNGMLLAAQPDARKASRPGPSRSSSSTTRQPGDRVVLEGADPRQPRPRSASTWTRSSRCRSRVEDCGMVRVGASASPARGRP